MRKANTYLALAGAFGLLLVGARADEPAPVEVVEATQTSVATIHVDGMTGAQSCGQKVARALEGLEGVSRVESHCADFNVAFDPARVNVQRMLTAVQGAGYRANQVGPTRVVVDLDAVRIEVRPNAANHRAGARGAITVKLTVKPGHRLGGDEQRATRVSAEEHLAADAEAKERRVSFPEREVAVTDALTGDRELPLALRVERRTPAGERTIVVTLEFQDRTAGVSAPVRSVSVRVPIVIE